MSTLEPHAGLVLGGARSGKSAHAEKLAKTWASRNQAGLVYLATSEIFDSEMAERIAIHRGRRGSEWRLVEEPVELRAALSRESAHDQVILVDCLTLWLSNILHVQKEIAEEIRKLADLIAALPGPVIMVSNELGMGIVPENAMAREFRDHHGRLNQEIAAAVDHVDFVAAGIPLNLKSLSEHK